MSAQLQKQDKKTREFEIWESTPWYARLCLEFGYSLQRLATALPIYLADILTIIGTFLFAVLLTPSGNVVREHFLPIIGCDILVGLAMGLPQVIGTHPIIETRRIFLTACVTLAIMSSAVLYLRRPDLLPVIATSQLVLVLTLPCSRVVIRNLMSRQSWWGVRTVVLGCGNRLTSLFRDHFVSLSNGLRLVGFYEDRVPEECPDELSRYYLGPNDAAHRAPLCHHAYHAIVHRFGREDHELVRFAHQYLFNFRKIDFATDSLLLPAFWTSSSDVGATREIELAKPSSRIVKRCFDILIAALLLLATLPLITILAIVVKFTSRGPAISKTPCVGLHGKTFSRYQLRSDAATIAEIVSKPGDEAARALGATLRRYGIDQLPQMWNVLKGDMSLVGPKPSTPDEAGEVASDEPVELPLVRPGVFGIRQFLKQETRNRRRELDVFYVRKWSIWFDIYIIGLTAKQRLCSNG